MLKIINHFFNFCQKENKIRFYKSIVLTFIESLFNSLKIAAIFVFITGAIEGSNMTNISLITLGIMLVSIIGSYIVRYFSMMLQTEGGYDTCARKRMEIAEHLRYVPMGYYNENSIGQVLSVTTNTMQFLENLATRVIMLVSSAVLSTLVITIIILIFDYRIGLVLVAGLLLFALVTHLLMKKSDKISYLKYQSDENLITQILEYIEGINEVKSYKLVGKKCKKLNEANDKSADINYKMEINFIPYIGLQSMIIKLFGVLIIFLSIMFNIQGTMPLANTLIMIISSFIIYATLENASSFTALLRNIETCIKKGENILKSPQMNLEGDKEAPINHNIEVNNVSFSYGKKKIIDNVSLKIKENTVTAFVGPSGGGKTTLTKLIARFFDVDEGSITLGGKNIKDYNYDTLMKNFSFVFQNVYLFKDTIANNIRFGTRDASMDEVIEAAKKANCHEFIMKLEKGYDTVIGEDGINLSGGERQRLSIARAMMKDAPIIVLDEATANVDPENEKELVEAIGALTKNKTIIMIAHRLKTVRNADQIFVIENGKIREQGNHSELIKKDGLYKKFISLREKATSWKIS